MSGPSWKNKAGCRFAILAAAAAPLAAMVPYLWRAWETSPVDRAHLKFFGVLALIAVAAGCAVFRRLRFAIRPGGVAAAAFFAVAVLMFALGVYRDVNAIKLLAGVCILWSAAWGLFGHVAAGIFAPAALLAFLAVPGTLYWLQNASFAFAPPPCAAFTPEFTEDSQNGMLGRELQPTADFSRFFRTSSARQFMYATPSNSIWVLAVRVGDNIHEIHPATHCLRSAGWRVESEKLFRMRHPAGGEFEVDEAVVESLDGKMLVWIWYSSDDVSTGSFLTFRRMYSAAAPWRTYQVSTAFGDAAGALDAARAQLALFIGTGVADD